ncbi:peptide chain release factor N(5)-glutamine methyltransferase [Ureaplasma ceti]|uniref:peptide chain release factor N(5)-glutamine methyltransferase n=1 Tax=Ureaplasma ceti TaxID=3119530 RepID=A0ABP9U8E8_9BACT
MTYLDLILNMVEQLKKANQNDEVAFFLLYHFTEVESKLEFINHKTDICNEAYLCLQALQEYLVDNKPLSKILHEETFYKLNFKVLDGVFSPRHDTEILVNEVLKFTSQKDNLDIADICSGTGIIGLSLKENLNPNNRFYLVDLNPLAIKNIQLNAQALELQTNLQIYQGDLFSELIARKIKLDVLVSNPPYIDKAYQLDKNVETYDPSLALFAEDHGLDIYRKLLSDFRKVVKNPQRYLIGLEIGFDQAEAVTNLALEYLDVTKDEIHIIQDYNQLDRVVIINKNF